MLCRAAREHLAELLADRAVRPVPRQNLHVTVRFLGQLDAGAVADVAAAVGDLQATPIRVAVTGFAGFPRLSAARVLIAEVAPHSQLSSWRGALDARLGRADQDLHPHVTIARSRRALQLQPLQLAEPLWLTLAAPALYRSDPTPSGARYQPLADSSRSEPGIE